MKNSSIIKQVIEKYNNYNLKHPKFSAENLYVGKIVVSSLENSKPCSITIKPFAILYKGFDGAYVHVKSGKRIKELSSITHSGLAVKNIHPLDVKFAKDASVLHDCDKLSRQQLTKIEDAQNAQLSVSCEACKVFGV